MSKRNQSVGSGKHTFGQRMAWAKRHITGKHGPRPPRQPYKAELGKGGILARWISKQPITGRTTPPRTPEYKRIRWAELRKALLAMGMVDVMKAPAEVEG